MTGIAVPPTDVADRRWHRFTFGQRLARFVVYLVLVVTVVASARTVELAPEFLRGAPGQVADLVARMWPIDWPHYQDSVHAALMETIHIASLGTLLALLLSLPLGVLAAHHLVPFTPVNLLARVILASSRSVHSLVWALLFVALFGPGALAGTLAIAFRSIGFVGRLFSEALGAAKPGPIEALTAAGAPWMSRLTFGYWPQAKPAFWSIALFRWDSNVRESAVLGLVGAGGIGMALDTALNLFQWGRVALILIAMLAVVVIVDVVVAQVRRRVIR